MNTSLLSLKPRFQNRGRDRGMIMMDALAGMFFGTMGMVACLSVLMSANSGADSAKQGAIAYSAGRQVVENLRVFKAAKLPVGSYNDVTRFGPVPQLALLNGGAAQMTVAKAGSGMRQATITITWRAGGNVQAKSRTVVALFSPNGVTP